MGAAKALSASQADGERKRRNATVEGTDLAPRAHLLASLHPSHSPVDMRKPDAAERG